MNKILAKKIHQMAKEDQRIRKNHHKGSTLDPRIDKENTNKLKKIVMEYGWPTISLVGKKASRNAWLLVQHADHDPVFQKSILKLLKKIDHESHDIDRANIAYLTDRLLVAKKQKQQFGTQFSFDKIGRLKLNPIKNPEKIDIIRKAYNLPPLKDFIKTADEFNAKLTKENKTK